MQRFFASLRMTKWSVVSGPTASKTDAGIYALGSFLGVCAGLLDVKIGDLLLTALFVMAATMLLGSLRPAKPWRWVIVIASFVPALQVLAYLVMTEKPYRAQIWESFLGFLTGLVGAYAGAFMRRVVDNLRQNG